MGRRGRADRRGRGAPTFEENRMGVDQLTAGRPGAAGESGVPATREHG
ncbi:hypothetical protein [Amycolatopsis magusensis]|uniref:Uncharacterized protein n=1 Tax=Amycolatopsis magusensis TaxID=882444 RepID=A0ABS4Q2W2_9PSEU|nr:hypothetical protein [Amycolatopsis magusensis]MBP2186033.1 hypothetical protein [Amycolatopsis magusensis]MDI5982447.1 hypothetical protein [Amycolatopsis magusensis]